MSCKRTILLSWQILEGEPSSIYGGGAFQTVDIRCRVLGARSPCLTRIVLEVHYWSNPEWVQTCLSRGAPFELQALLRAIPHASVPVTFAYVGSALRTT